MDRCVGRRNRLVAEGQEVIVTMPGTSPASDLPETAQGPSFEMAWDKATTPLEAIERAVYALADRLTGTIADGGESWRLTAHTRGTASDDVALSHRLRQEVNDQTLRVRIAERTDPVRNLVFALAFSRTGLAGGQADASEGPAQ
jgi:His-Xaa-Ser system protein HxsD